VRDISPEFQAHLDSGTTTICHCWRLETTAGDVMGFTDHDNDLVVDGVTYEAQAGFTASEIESSLGLSIDNLDAAGALSSGRLTEERLKAGDFDNAEVEIWRVNWQDVSQRLLMRKGNLGEITHGSLGFTAEVRGLAHILNQPRGRIYQFACDAVLGDGRCGVDLEAAAYRGTAVVVATEEDRRLTVSGIEGFDDGWFARGTIQWDTGANTGRRGEVKSHRVDDAGVVIELWAETGSPVTAGDQLAVRAGCDKQFASCKSKFVNGVNYRGFPQIPGDDFVLSYASRNDPNNDGKRRS
jgi:uncharacterized phage protein (TIGR02218 family)